MVIWRKIENSDFVVFEDPKWPTWTKDPRVWKYLRKNYKIDFGGWIDDSDTKPPLLMLKKVRR